MSEDVPMRVAASEYESALISQTDHPSFLGSRIFIEADDFRKELPFKCEMQEVALWKIIKKFIG
jgi:hypothetical protein